jgi:hypothetical protein
VNLTEAAETWKANKPIAREADRQVKAAEKVLKEWFRQSGKATFKGIAYTCTEYDALDAELARGLLGDKAAEAEVARTRETLTAI